MIHTVKGFGIVNKAVVFLEISCFFYDPTNVGDLISGSFTFSKSSLNIWKFTVHVLLKPGLENFEHYFASMCCCCEVASVMSDSHRWQPTRLPCPWDSPGKNTGVGCHFFLQCIKSEKWKWSRSVVSNSQRPHGPQPTRLLRPWDFPGKSTGVGCHCLLRVQCEINIKIMNEMLCIFVVSFQDLTWALCL